MLMLMLTLIIGDMSNIPLESGSVDVVVYCLSLMGTNVGDFLKEVLTFFPTSFARTAS